MSISPNDSFDSDFSNDGGIQTAPASKSSSKKGCLIGALVAFLVLMLVCCGGILFLFYFGQNALGELVVVQVENDPAIVEHIGSIESCSLDFGATAAAAEAAEQPGDPTPMAFQLEGSKGEGTLLMMPASKSGDPNNFSSGTLVLPSGERIPLQELGQGSPDLEELGVDDDFDLEDLIDVGDAASPADPETSGGIAAPDVTEPEAGGGDAEPAPAEGSPDDGDGTSPN